MKKTFVILLLIPYSIFLFLILMIPTLILLYLLTKTSNNSIDLKGLLGLIFMVGASIYVVFTEFKPFVINRVKEKYKEYIK